MKIAVTSTGPTLDDTVESRFGRCRYFLVVDTDSMQFEAIENPNISLGGGAGIQSAQMMSEKGVSHVLTGNCGPNAFRVFGEVGVEVMVGVTGTVRQAIEQFKVGKLSSASAPNVQSHFGMTSEQQNQLPPSTLNDPPMAGAGMGMGRGGGFGGGRGMGKGRGMGRGRGMGMGRYAGMPGPAGFETGQPTFVPSDRDQELAALKKHAEILQQQRQQIEKRISEIETGHKAAAFVQADKCTGCGICVDVCPVNAIRVNKQATVNQDLCTACAACVSACPNGAIIITQNAGK
ncbi:MAG: 4Fe-4S binding protein [Sedimentisphaerales bacterium]|nr:4Fe-4S binding protein [Sedimentisphaerales bacterium]